MSTAPYETSSWRLVLGHTALVVIDPQNDFLHNDGWYAKSGVDVAHMQRSIEPTRRPPRRGLPRGRRPGHLDSSRLPQPSRRGDLPAILEGHLPARVRGLIEEWAEQHQQELLVMWDSKEFHKIAPLV